MSDEEYNQHLVMIKYFWQENRDIERYVGWESVASELYRRNPEIYKAYWDYLSSERLMSELVEKVELGEF